MSTSFFCIIIFVLFLIFSFLSFLRNLVVPFHVCSYVLSLCFFAEIFLQFLGVLFTIVEYSLCRGLVDNHYQGQTLVALPEMQHRSFLADGWEWVPCFHSAVGIRKLEQLIMSHGLLAKRYFFTHLLIDV